MASRWIKWYTGRLQSHPMSTNMGSALLFMTAGDLMAQKIESKAAATVTNSNSQSTLVQRFATAMAKEGDSKQPKLSYRRYGTLSPDLKAIKEKAAHEAANKDGSYYATEQGALLLDTLQESWISLQRSIRTQFESIDYFRSATMAYWAVGVHTPFFILLYRLFDRYLPKSKTAAVSSLSSVASRVGMSFVVSIPSTAFFFCYGCFIHHVTEYVALVEEYQRETLDTEFRPPFDLEMAWSTARLKLETELGNTVVSSACLWVPVNTLNFALVPPHLRPLVVMFTSAFWNCYLSLVQHRDAEIETQQ